MKLQDIGFYTLSDVRSRSASPSSPLWRCELIVSGRCNLKCPYCRGVRPEIQDDLPLSQAISVLDLWIAEGLKNVRFSGGEPTLYPDLTTLIDHCRNEGVERIAISTNGTAEPEIYQELLERGMNDCSISLDGACCAVGKEMTGGINGVWKRTVETIRMLAPVSYVTVGMVFTEINIEQCVQAVKFVDSLGVSDIRVIPAAQYNKALLKLTELPENILQKYPILLYRVNNMRIGCPVRGIAPNDCNRCWLGLDDMAVAGKWHFPCIIHLREGGNPIGKIGTTVRQDRAKWVSTHDTHADPICKKNCLDVCVYYNNTAATTH